MPLIKYNVTQTYLINLKLTTKIKIECYQTTLNETIKCFNTKLVSLINH